MRSVVAPEVDMLVVAKSARNQRKSIMNFAPKIGLSVVDYGRLDEIDYFYQDCQNFRDYFRDPYNKLSRPVAFYKHYGKCGKKMIDKNSQLLLMPNKWVQESTPVVYPIPHRRELQLDEGIQLGGQYNIQSCIKYKR